MPLSIHWLRGTTDMDVLDMSSIIQDCTSTHIMQSLDTGRYRYRKTLRYMNNIVIYYDPSEPNMPQCCVDIIGTVCETLSFQQLQVIACNLKLTRVDLALDGCPFTPKHLWDATENGDFRSRSRKRSYIVSKGSEKSDGYTFNFGSRQSPTMLRCYDMRETGTRLELELKAQAAQSFKAYMLQSDDLLPQVFMGILRSFVDFVDHTSDSNKSRQELLPWWSAFTDEVDRIYLQKKAKAPRTIPQMANWLEQQCARVMLICQRSGHSVYSMMSKAHHNNRLTPDDMMMIDHYRQLTSTTRLTL